MRKFSILLTLSLLIVVVATSAFATTSRQIALANSGDYFNDNANIFRWNGVVSSYNNIVMVEAGQATIDGGVLGGGVTADYQALGFASDFGKSWGTFGIYLLHNSTEDMSLYLFRRLGSPGILGDAIPTTKYALQWGKEFEKLAFGAEYTRSDVSVETSGATGTKNDYSFSTFSGGVRLDINDDMYLDANIGFGLASGDTVGGFDKGSSFNLAARMFWELRDDMTFVPLFDWSNYDFAYKNDTEPTGDKVSDILLGLALNMDVNSNNMLIFAAEYNSLSWKYSKAGTDQSEVTSVTLPLFRIALESDINSWLTTRVGAYKSMTKLTVKDAAGDEISITGPIGGGSPGIDDLDDFAFFLGAGFHLGEWDIDAVLNNDTPFRLGYWLTGYGAGDPDPVVGRVSATYRY